MRTLLLICLLLGGLTSALAHDHARPELDKWYRELHSNSGSWCCDGDEATHVADVDWEVKGGHYRVRINGEWLDVPDSAVIHDPNLDGRTLVWPGGYGGVRCFLPGAGT